MSLYRNINKKKRAGTSRSKKKSTISAKAYKNMKAGFENTVKAKNKADREKANKEEEDAEKAKAEAITKATRDGEIAQKMNLGNANNTKIVQSIGALYDEDWNEITSGYDKDMQLFANQKTEAYANMNKTYNSLKPPTDPSRAGLMLDIASSANSGYQRSQTKTQPKVTN